MSTAEVLPLPRKPPHPGDLIKIVRKLAKDGAVSFSEHAFEVRGPDREIGVPDALRILQKGMIRDGSIKPGNNPGEWKCLVVDRADPPSRRWIGVATVVIGSRNLLIATVEWIDP